MAARPAVRCSRSRRPPLVGAGCTTRRSSPISRGCQRRRCRSPALLVRGFWYSGTILAILGCHELGHYFACRYYDVDASLPFFLPVAVAADRHAGRVHPHPRADSAASACCSTSASPDRLPASWSPCRRCSSASRCRTSSTLPPDCSRLMELGEPLLFKLAVVAAVGHASPDGYTVNMHPMAFAAWFGLLATALNLFPIGQLDGGHISYAVLGPRASTLVTFAMVAVRDRASRASRRSWIVWTVLTIAMLFVFGPRHPRVFDEDVPLDRTRIALALFARADVRALLHAGADRADRRHSAASKAPGRRQSRARSRRVRHVSRSHHSTLSGSTSTIARRCSSGRARARPAAPRASACGSCP